MLSPDHPQRMVLADEVHARPPEPLETPSRATYIALLVAPEDREREFTHIAALCERFGVAPPHGGVTQFAAQLGPVRFKWERHGEFSSFTLFAAAHAKLIAASVAPSDAAALAGHFGGNIVVGAQIGDGAGMAYTDFRSTPTASRVFWFATMVSRRARPAACCSACSRSRPIE